MAAYEFDSISAAKQAAKDQSVKNPGIGWYVNWLEDNFWSISIFQDYEDQEYYMSGQLMYPEHFGEYE